MKKCSKCKINNELSNFRNEKNTKSGLSYWCKSCLRENQRIWRESHRDKIKQYAKKYVANGRKLRYHNDSQYRLSQWIRIKLGKFLNKKLQFSSFAKDLGCSYEELKIHLEKKFKDDMTWENRAVNGWHVDHIISLSKFNLTNRKEYLKAVHFTNLQPLWADENRKKWAN